MPGDRSGRVVLRAVGLPLPPGINHQYGRRGYEKPYLTPRAELWLRGAVEKLETSMIEQQFPNQAKVKINQRTHEPYLAPDRKQIVWLDVFYEMWTFNQDGDAPEKMVIDAVQAALGLDDWWASPPLGVKHIVHRKVACRIDIVVAVEWLPHEQAWNKRAERRAVALRAMMGVER